MAVDLNFEFSLLFCVFWQTLEFMRHLWRKTQEVEHEEALALKLICFPLFRKREDVTCTWTTTLLWWWEESKTTFELWIENGCKIACKSSLPCICKAWACKCNTLWMKHTFPNPAQHLGRTGNCTPLDMFVQLSMSYLQLQHLFQMGTRHFCICSRDQLFSAHWIVSLMGCFCRYGVLILCHQRQIESI